MSIITVERKVLEKNDEVAAELKSIFIKRKIFVLNVLSSPGSGKTTLLEKTLKQIKEDIKVAVIEGDVQTDYDAQRIAKYKIPVVQIVTNGGCHLDALLVRDALKSLTLDGIQMLFIENVGNLVCPASYDLGEHKKIVIVSTTEGDDKPVKYPKMFRVADVCILNKIDLLAYVDFDVSTFHANAKKVNPNLLFIELSAKTGAGLEDWLKWLKEQL
ncbi:hydrogenase nickel incorporation protein HypB [candidate division KSB1 bacterium]|nr:hydrogenase nickel incorporation protein HypB [candidate division KSB1 bacterium]